MTNILHYTHSRASSQDKVLQSRHYLKREGLVISFSASRTFLMCEPAVWLLGHLGTVPAQLAPVMQGLSGRSRVFISISFWKYRLQLSFSLGVTIVFIIRGNNSYTVTVESQWLQEFHCEY